MHNEHRPKPINWHLRFSLISGLFMVFIFISMGIALLSLPEFLPQAHAPWRNYTGWFLLCWAGFRLMLIRLRYRQLKRQSENAA